MNGGEVNSVFCVYVRPLVAQITLVQSGHSCGYFLFKVRRFPPQTSIVQYSLIAFRVHTHSLNDRAATGEQLSCT